MALDFEIAPGISVVFATPLLIRKMPDAESVNEGLRRAILKAEAEDASVEHSNVGGWQSPPTILEWPVPEIQTLQKWIEEATIQLTSLPSESPLEIAYHAYGWANINRNGHYNRVHNHGEEHWAVVYYVTCGEKESGHRMNGKIELRDPRPAASASADDKYFGYTFGAGLLIEPESSMLLAFPAWLDHCVHPFFGQGERISIAVNVRLDNVRVTSEQEHPVSA